MDPNATHFPEPSRKEAKKLLRTVQQFKGSPEPTPPKPVKALPCDGVPRYSYKGKKRLTYSEAWNAVVDDHQGKDGKISSIGFHHLKRLNRKHSAIIQFNKGNFGR